VSTTNTSVLARERLARGTDPIRRPTTELNPTLPTTMRSAPALYASFSSASAGLTVIVLNEPVQVTTFPICVVDGHKSWIAWFTTRMAWALVTPSTPTAV
jgi:hypothetical protein